MDQKGFDSGTNLYSLANSKADNIKDFIIEDEGYDAENPNRVGDERFDKKREEYNKDIIDGYCVWGWGEKYNKRDGYNWIKVSKKPVYWIPKDISYTDTY